MPVTKLTTPNMVNGVSQQSDSLRLNSQCEEAINTLPSVVKGLGKRPPTEHRGVLSSSPGNIEDNFYHFIHRDVNEKYVVNLKTNGTITVHDLDGNAKTVNTPDGVSYINGNWTDPSQLTALTIADYTFLVNKNVTVGTTGLTTTSGTKQAVVYCKQGQFGKTYKIKLNGTTYSYTTPNGDQPTDIEWTGTYDILFQLVLAINAGTSDYNLYIRESTLTISRFDGQDFTIETDDEFGGKSMYALKDSTNSYEKLPNSCGTNFRIKITGDPSSDYDDYYIQFKKPSGSSGYWEEVPAPGIVLGLDPGTMPHVLVRESDGTFTFREADWDTRIAGDDKSNPLPSFVGRKLNDIVFYRNRLGFLSGESEVYSEAGNYFNFFATTVATALDSAPIDLDVPHNKVSILNYALPFNEDLIAFSEQTQFRTYGGDLFTNATVATYPSTEFACSSSVKPVQAGTSIYFCANTGLYTRLMDFYKIPEANNYDAQEVNSHIPRYIPSGIRKLAASTENNILLALSINDPEKLYVYNYYWTARERIQSAWHKWDFSVATGTTQLRAMEFVGEDLFIVVNRDGQLCLERVMFSESDKDNDARYITYLDRRIDQAACTVAYDAGTDYTTWTLPYTNTDDDLHIVVKEVLSNQIGTQGYIVPHEQVDSTHIRARGDWTGTPVWIGKNYRMEYEYSKPVQKKQDISGDVIAVGSGRLQLKTATIKFSDTSYFRVEVTPKERDTYTYVYTGRILGTTSSVLGEAPVSDGEFAFPIHCRSEDAVVKVINDKPFPCYLNSTEWKAVYSKKGRKS